MRADGRQVSYAGVPAGATGTAVNRVAFSNDGGLVLAVRSNGDVDIYDAGTGEAAVPLTTPAGFQSYAVGFVASGTEVWGVRPADGAEHLGPADTTDRHRGARAGLGRAAPARCAPTSPLPHVPALGKPAARST